MIYLVYFIVFVGIYLMYLSGIFSLYLYWHFLELEKDGARSQKFNKAMCIFLGVTAIIIANALMVWVVVGIPK